MASTLLTYANEFARLWARMAKFNPGVRDPRVMKSISPRTILDLVDPHPDPQSVSIPTPPVSGLRQWEEILEAIRRMELYTKGQSEYCTHPECGRIGPIPLTYTIVSGGASNGVIYTHRLQRGSGMEAGGLGAGEGSAEERLFLEVFCRTRDSLLRICAEVREGRKWSFVDEALYWDGWHWMGRRYQLQTRLPKVYEYCTYLTRDSEWAVRLKGLDLLFAYFTADRDHLTKPVPTEITRTDPPLRYIRNQDTMVCYPLAVQSFTADQCHLPAERDRIWAEVKEFESLLKELRSVAEKVVAGLIVQTSRSYPTS